jgi:hypothetical protein
MSNATFTKEELRELRLACTWAVQYWDEVSQRKPEEEKVCRGIKHSYMDLWNKVNAVMTAQDSSLLPVAG